MKDIGDVCWTLLNLETEIHKVASGQEWTDVCEYESLIALALQLHALNCQLFDVQTRLLRQAGISHECENKTPPPSPCQGSLSSSLGQEALEQPSDDMGGMSSP